MDTTKLACIFVRFTAVTYVIGGLFELTYLPSRLYAASQLHYTSSIASSHLDLGMLVFRVGLHLLVSAILWFQAEPLVLWLAVSLEGVRDSPS